MNEKESKKHKGNPRSWSSKFWKKNNISDILKEVIEPDVVDVSSIKMNDTLNNDVWDENEKLKPEVRKILLMNARKFIEFSDLENLTFQDVTFTGSMANYNYNENSDIDIHIVMDFSQISDNVDFVGEFLRLKKKLWSEKLPIQVKGHDVELYYQNDEQEHHSTGIYSLIKDEWIRKPIKQIINIDTANVQLKTSHFINAIDELEKQKHDKNFIKNYKRIKEKIKKYRQQGLESVGEFSTENLVFKVLRNTGYLEKLSILKREHLTKKLSLENKNVF